LVAGRFVDKEYVYAYDQVRDGSSHTNLSKMDARTLEPIEWRYDRPVILLIGQQSMSSCEAFVGMMLGDDKVTTMGDHTAGSSGDPYFQDLPMEMTVGMPRWIYYKADHKPLDENGYQPQIPFQPEPGAFGKNRDDLLSAALARLRQTP
jgi:C-terminal processing protease CtpA/Prc